MKQGTGKYTYPDKSTVECQFHENEIPDQKSGVKWFWPLGVHKKKLKTYRGGWLGGKFHGKKCSVKHHYTDEDKKLKGIKYEYDGEMANGKYHGKGKVSWDGGDKVYEGEFVKGKQHGKGKYGIKKGKSMKYKTGVWENNKNIKWDEEAE